MEYTNSDYARSRLAGTIVRLDKDPVTFIDCTNSLSGITAVVKKLGSAKSLKCNIKDLNLKPIPLGNINYRGRSSFMARMPMRRDWRQGLRSSNVSVLNRNNSENPGSNKSSLLASKGFVNCVKNIYPSFSDCLESLVNEEAKGIAFSKKFSLASNNHGIDVYYRGNKRVGVVQNDEIVLFDDFKHLKEALSEIL